MPITNSYAQEVMIGAIGEGSLTPPTELWLALHTANPGRDGSFANEVAGPGYARMEVTNLISSVQGCWRGSAPTSTSRIRGSDCRAARCCWSSPTNTTPGQASPR